MNYCKKCQEKLYNEDEYVKVDGEVCCMLCLENMSTRELIQALGFEVDMVDDYDV